jgi:nitroreductase
MEKPATTEFPVHDLLRLRWSPRAFSGKPVPLDVLRSLFEAARWAPSSFNEQPWAYLVATRDDPENFATMLSVLVEFNASWAKHAPLLALAVAELAFHRNGNPNRNAFYDVGAASAQLTFEANSRGLLVHQMAGYDGDKARRVFEIPEGWEPIAAIALGYPGDPETLPQPLRDRELAPRSRKSLSEFVMTGRWGHTSPFITK